MNAFPLLVAADVARYLPLRILTTMLTALLIAVISISISSLIPPKMHLLDYYVFGRRFTFTESKRQEIALVLIDDATIAHYRSASLKRSAYATVIASILKGRPRVIGIDIFFDGIKDLEDDIKLLGVLDRADASIVLAVYPLEAGNMITAKAKSVSTGRSYGLNNVTLGNVDVLVERGIAGVAKVSAVPFIDRRHEKEYLPFPVMVASKYLGVGYEQRPLRDGSLVAVLGDVQIPLPSGGTLINYVGGVQTFDVISFAKVADADPKIFRDRIVLIGGSTEDPQDTFITPVSRRTPGVVIHANAIDTILSRRFISELPPVYQLILPLVLCVITSMGGLIIRPVGSLVVSVLLVIASRVIADYIFAKYRVLVVNVPLLSSMVFSYCATWLWVKIGKRDVKVCREDSG